MYLTMQRPHDSSFLRFSQTLHCGVALDYCTYRFNGRIDMLLYQCVSLYVASLFLALRFDVRAS
jgi:hypothetical protein